MIIDENLEFHNLNKEAEEIQALKKQQRLNGMKILLKRKERDYKRRIS